MPPLRNIGPYPHWWKFSAHKLELTVGNVYNTHGTLSLGEGGGFVTRKKYDQIYKLNQEVDMEISKVYCVDIRHRAHFVVKNWLNVIFYDIVKFTMVQFLFPGVELRK